MTPLLVVLSSPSGVGKTTLAERLLSQRTDVGRSISATTRAPRAGEVDGRDYYFLSRPEFARRFKAGEFLESAMYGGNRYGTLRSEVARIHETGRHALLVIEVSGARQVRRRFRKAVQVFLLPPSGQELIRRLTARRTEAAAVLRSRLAIAKRELGAVAEYDYVILNDELELAVREVSAILDAETRRVKRQPDVSGRIQELRREIAVEAKRLKTDLKANTPEQAPAVNIGRSKL